MRYLLFRSDPSPIGLSNLRMSLDIGVGLATLTDRTLVFYENEPAWDGPEPVLARTHPDDPRPTILDLFDVPVPQLDERFASHRLASGSLHATHWADVCESAFAHPRDLDDDARFAAFVNGRRHSYRLSPAAEEAEFLQVSCRTFGLYSYFFYVSPQHWPRLRAAMTQVQAKAPYLELAADFARALAPFNALHLRRTDSAVPRPRPVTATEILTTAHRRRTDIAADRVHRTVGRRATWRLRGQHSSSYAGAGDHDQNRAVRECRSCPSLAASNGSIAVPIQAKSEYRNA